MDHKTSFGDVKSIPMGEEEADIAMAKFIDDIAKQRKSAIERCIKLSSEISGDKNVEIKISKYPRHDETDGIVKELINKNGLSADLDNDRQRYVWKRLVEGNVSKGIKHTIEDLRPKCLRFPDLYPEEEGWRTVSIKYKLTEQELDMITKLEISESDYVSHKIWDMEREFKTLIEKFSGYVTK